MMKLMLLIVMTMMMKMRTRIRMVIMVVMVVMVVIGMTDMTVMVVMMMMMMMVMMMSIMSIMNIMSTMNMMSIMTVMNMMIRMRMRVRMRMKRGITALVTTWRRTGSKVASARSMNLCFSNRSQIIPRFVWNQSTATRPNKTWSTGAASDMIHPSVVPLRWWRKCVITSATRKSLRVVIVSKGRQLELRQN